MGHRKRVLQDLVPFEDDLGARSLRSRGMAGGHQHEKRISENDGDEGAYQFEAKNNTYDLARKYAAHPKPPLRMSAMLTPETADR